MAEQFGVEGGHHVRGPADTFGLADEAPAHQFDEVLDVGVDGPVGAVRVIGRLGLESTLRPVTRAGLSPVRWS